MRRMRMSLVMALFAVPALGQTDGTYLLVSSNTVSPATPTTTIEVWTTWTDPGVPRPLFLFGGGDYDLTAGDGQFSNPVNVLNGPGSTTGVIAGNVISGARNGQLHGFLGIFGSPDNPILLATHDWTTLDFTPRSVSLDTSSTTAFFVIWISDGPLRVPPMGAVVHLFPQEFTPGSSVISVVPAPGAWVVLALPLAGAARRRRL